MPSPATRPRPRRARPTAHRRAPALLLAGALTGATACGHAGREPLADGGGDAPGDGGGGPLLPRCEISEPATRDAPAPVASTLVGTVVASEAHLEESGPENPATETGEALYADLGLGEWARGEGLARLVRDELGGGGTPAERRSLAWFVHVSDFQLVDDESPVRWAALDNPETASGLRAHEALVARGVSAMNRRLAALERAERPYDFAVVTGDCADDGQENELGWVLDLMDGVPGLETDSGDDDDPIPGPDNDPKDPFDPVAFPAPWLFVPGNHDVLAVGLVPLSDTLDTLAVGSSPANGTRDYRRWFAPVTRGRVPEDARRRPLERGEIVSLLFAREGGAGPAGHGYPSASADVSGGAHYAYDAIPELLRVLALDSSDVDGGSHGLVTRATVDDWLVPELERAETDGVLVMLASHHPTTSIDRTAGILGAERDDAVPPDELEALLADHPAVIAWLVGHEHEHRIRAIAGPDAARPGYWEIETASLVDWPQEARLLELVDNGDGTLSIFATLIDHEPETCFERRFRRLALMEMQAGWAPRPRETSGDQNVELRLPVPASAAAAVAAARTGAVTRLESETTLRGL